MATETVIHLFSSLAHSGRHEIGHRLSVVLGPLPMLPTIRRSSSLFLDSFIVDLCQSSHVNARWQMM